MRLISSSSSVSYWPFGAYTTVEEEQTSHTRPSGHGSDGDYRVARSSALPRPGGFA